MFFRPPNSAPSFRQCLKPSTPEVTPEQRRQSGSKSRGRESGRKKVSNTDERISDFQEKFPIFQANILTTFLVLNSKNYLFSQNIHIFTFYTYILTYFFSLSYKKTLSNVLSVQNRL